MPKWLALGVVLLVVLYTIAQPHHAADIANGAWNIADNAGHRLSSFVSDLHS